MKHLNLVPDMNSEFSFHIPTKAIRQNPCKPYETMAKSKTTYIHSGVTKW